MSSLVRLRRKESRPLLRATETDKDILSRFGFVCSRATELRYTFMFDSLTSLLSIVEDVGAKRQDYRHAIVDENCLGKHSYAARTGTFQNLVRFYGLSPSFLLFRALRYFWKRDSATPVRALLAMQCASARDPFLSEVALFLERLQGGEIANRQALEMFICQLYPGRFSKTTLVAMSSKTFSTWVKAGYLSGGTLKVRSHGPAAAANVSYALLLGYLLGVRGEMLFATNFMKLLDCTYDEALKLAANASQKGWIVFKRVGNVIEVLFPLLVSYEEKQWLR